MMQLLLALFIITIFAVTPISNLWAADDIEAEADIDTEAPQPFLAIVKKPANKNGHIILSDDRRIKLDGIVLFPEGIKHLRELITKGTQVRVIPAIKSPAIQLRAEVEILPDFFIRDEMLKAGHAIMFPFYLDYETASHLRELERIGAEKQVGIWRNQEKAFRPIIVDALQAANHIGEYRIVRDVIVNHETRKNVVYLNFGDEWQTDFTVRAIDTRFLLIQNKLGWPDDLRGFTIECRGTIHEFYGPAIDLNHYGQCEIIP
ncbi:MAG: hypothetical protein K0U45_10360 [Alphaproteobacteria bacterium]|nr:hypothetical protein [Alphaproteobacteria bacterium]